MSVITTSTPASSKVQRRLKWLGDTGWLWRLRVALIATMHLTAVYVLASVEYGPFAMTLALLTWGLLNFLWLIAFRRPGVSAALSLGLVGALIVLSQFKYGITQLTLTFLDFLIIDRDTVSFLHSIFPQLKTQSIVLVAIAVPVMWLVWRADPFRVRRATAAAGAGVCMLGIVGLSVANPEQPWEPFQGVNHISNLARSGVVSVSHLTSTTGWIEADSKSLVGSAQATPLTTCTPRGKRPNIIMVLDESSFDITAAPGIKVPEDYRNYFKSSDGQRRSFVTESSGGPTWYTEFNVLTGLSARVIRQDEVLCHADHGGEDFARAAAGVATVRVPDVLAVSDLREFPQCAQVPDLGRGRQVHRHGRHGRQRRHAARQVLFRSGAATDRA